MIPKIEPQADAQYIYVKKEAFYKGNFISLMCESFFLHSHLRCFLRRTYCLFMYRRSLTRQFILH